MGASSVPSTDIRVNEPGAWSSELPLLRFDRYEVDIDRYELRRDGVVVALRPRTFDLLVLLLRHRHRVLSKEELLATLWAGTVVTKGCLPHAIMALRRALADGRDGSRFVLTVRNRGYRFASEVELAESAADARVDPSRACHAMAVDFLRAAVAALVIGDHHTALSIVTSGLRALSSAPADRSP